MPREIAKDDAICITFDLDWAGDEIVFPIIESMQHAGVSATLFATHKSQLMNELDAKQFEIGLHPDFSQTEGDFLSPIQELKKCYPFARGARSHRLFTSSHILELYIQNGMAYESNTYLPFHERLHPVRRFQNLISIPFYWSDDHQVSFGGSFDLQDLHLDVPGLKVLNFHPIHVFMNTSSGKHYESYKPHYHDIDKLRKLSDGKREGVGTLFHSLLDYLSREQIATYLLYEICQNYRATIE